MNIADFKARLKAGKPGGWYIFCGEEDYLKKFYLGELTREVIGDGALDVFNRISFDTPEIDLGALMEFIETPPMFQEYKLIEWRFANLNSLKDSELKTFSTEIFPIKEEYPYAVFAIMTADGGFDVGSEKRPSRLAKLFGEKFDILNFPKSTDAQLLSWLKKHFDAEGISVTLDSLNTMLARVGHSMEQLNSEVKKLSAYLLANGRQNLTPKDVELVCPSNPESDAFAIQNSIIDGNLAKAFRALEDLKMRRTDPQILIGMLAKTYSTLSSVALLSEEGESFESIKNLLGLSAYPLQLYLRAAKKLGSKKINASLSELVRLDASSKFGGISGYEAIEIFITQNI